MKSQCFFTSTQRSTSNYLVHETKETIDNLIQNFIKNKEQKEHSYHNTFKENEEQIIVQKQIVSMFYQREE
jgi:hypothetical protein